MRRRRSHHRGIAVAQSWQRAVASCPAPDLGGSAKSGWMAEGEEHTLSVEPDVLEAKPVEDAVHDHCQPLDARLPAGGDARVEDDRARGVAREAPLDVPHQLPPLLGIWLARLPVDQRVDLLVAIAGVVAVRAADVV